MARVKIEIGEPTPYNKIHNGNRGGIKSIRGIYKAWQKAPTFILKLEALNIRYYLDGSGKRLTTKRSEAKVFKRGFDDPKIKIEFWNNQLGLKFHAEDY